MTHFECYTCHPNTENKFYTAAGHSGPVERIERISKYVHCAHTHKHACVHVCMRERERESSLGRDHGLFHHMKSYTSEILPVYCHRR